MRIGYFARSFPYKDSSENESYFGRVGCGGSPRSARYLAEAMAKRGHDVTVVTTSPSSEDSIEKDGGMTVHRYATTIHYGSSRISLSMLTGPWRLNDLDIVHGHFDIPPGPVSADLYARRYDVPFVLSYHGDWIADYGSFPRRLIVALTNRILVDKLLKDSDAIISPSSRYISSSRLNAFARKTVAVPNGVDLSEYRVDSTREECRRTLGLPVGKSIIVFVGAIEPYKGPHILLEAMARVVKSVPDTELVFVGKGSMVEDLVSMSRRLNIQDNIRFVGFVSDNQRKAMYYRSADVFAFPTFAESFGNVGLEAIAVGVPVVASNVGGVPDIVRNGEAGILVPPRDPARLADGLITLLEDSDLRERMGSAGRALAQNYSWDNNAASTERIYEGLLK